MSVLKYQLCSYLVYDYSLAPVLLSSDLPQELFLFHSIENVQLQSQEHIEHVIVVFLDPVVPPPKMSNNII